MKKAISLILAVALIASLAISAAAAGKRDYIEHIWDIESYTRGKSYPGSYGVLYGEDGLPYPTQGRAETVKILDISEGAKQILTTASSAITDHEIKVACDDVDEVGNLTVFLQRGVEAEGEIDLYAKSWQTGRQNRTVVLFKGDDEDEWTIIAFSELGEKTVQAVLPGTGAFAIAMSW